MFRRTSASIADFSTPTSSTVSVSVSVISPIANLGGASTLATTDTNDRSCSYLRNNATTPSSSSLKHSLSSGALNSVRSKVRALTHKLTAASPTSPTTSTTVSGLATSLTSLDTSFPGTTTTKTMAATISNPSSSVVAVNGSDPVEGATSERSLTVSVILDRLRQTRKELQTDLCFFKGVAAKNKSELLPAIATCILDTVLKLLLLFAETKTRFNVDSPAVVDGHKALLNALANLLRWTDTIQLIQVTPATQLAVDATSTKQQPEPASDSPKAMIDATAATQCCHELDRAIAELLSLVGEAVQQNDALDVKEFTDSPIFSSSSDSSSLEFINHNELTSLGTAPSSAADSHRSTVAPGNDALFTGGAIPTNYDPEVPPPKPPYPPHRLSLSSYTSKPNGSSVTAFTHADSGIGLNLSTECSPAETRPRLQASVDATTRHQDNAWLKPRLLYDDAETGQLTDSNQLQETNTKLSLDELLHQLNLISGSSWFQTDADEVPSSTATHEQQSDRDSISDEAREEESDCEASAEVQDEGTGDESIEETEELSDGCVRVRRILKKRRQVVRTKQQKQTVVTFASSSQSSSSKTGSCKNSTNGFGFQRQQQQQHEQHQSSTSTSCTKQVRSVRVSNNTVYAGTSGHSTNYAHQQDLPKLVRQPAIPVLLDNSNLMTQFAVEPTRRRLPSNYDNNVVVSQAESGCSNSNQQRQDSVDDCDAESRTRTTTESKLVCQSSSIQQFKQQLIVDGKIVAEDKKRTLDANLVKAAKSSVFENGNLVSQSGSGAVEQTNYTKRNAWKLPTDGDGVATNAEGINESVPGDSGCETTSDQAPPLPPKRKQIVEYMQVIGKLPTGCPSATYRKSALAAYSLLRDNWRLHEEALGHRAFSFQFSTNAASDPVARPDADANGQVAVDHCAIEPIEPDWMIKYRGSDYQNLQNFINLSECIQLPPRALTAAKTKNAIEFPKSEKPALMSLDALCDLDASALLIYNREDNDMPEIRGGSVDALVVHAAKNATSQKDFLFQECFLTTYRTILSPVDLMTKLMHRYNHFCSNKHSVTDRRASRNAFSLLIRVVDDLSPMETEPGVLSRLSDFTYAQVVNGDLALAKLLRNKMLEKIKQKALFDAKQLQLPAFPVNIRNRNVTILNFKPHVLAEQLTFLDAQYFQQIDLSEMLLWSQEQSGDSTPNLANFTEHFNKVSFWTRTKILAQPEAKDREKYTKHFVKIMKHLKHLGNFNSFLALLSAIDSGPVRRLEWPKQCSEALLEYSCLIDSSQSFKNYRCALVEAKPPCLPYIGLILQDLTFVHIGNPHFLPESMANGEQNMVNFGKRWQQFTILDSVRKFKSWSYSLKRNEKVLQAFAEFNDCLTEEQLWSLSETIKPRGKVMSFANI